MLLVPCRGGYRYTNEDRAEHVTITLKSLPKRLRTKVAREMEAFEKEKTAEILAKRKARKP